MLAVVGVWQPRGFAPWAPVLLLLTAAEAVLKPPAAELYSTPW